MTYFAITYSRSFYAVISILETVVLSRNSPLSKIFFKCLLIAGTCTPNSSDIAFCVIQRVSSRTTTCTFSECSGVLYNMNAMSFGIAFLSYLSSLLNGNSSLGEMWSMAFSLLMTERPSRCSARGLDFQIPRQA